MKKDDLWNRFYSTGRVDDYLEYIGSYTDDEVGDINVTDKDNRSDNQVV